MSDKTPEEIVDELLAQAGTGVVQLPSPGNPMKVARLFVDQHCLHDNVPTMYHWRGGWWRWRQTHWVEVEYRAVRSLLYTFTEHACYRDAEGNMVPWAPTRKKIGDLQEALAAITILADNLDQPMWLDHRESGVVVAVANGLLDVQERRLLPHSPLFFNQTSVPFDYDQEASQPKAWSDFLRALWPKEPAAIDALGEWFGYVISGRLDLHKILLNIGPTRGGKGVIARIETALIGRGNVAGPTLNSLGGEFGLAPLIGKPLAIISDARFVGKNSNIVVERLLSISGEDTLTVNRKYRDQWTGKLPSRLHVISNELPQLGDASTAIVGRIVLLPLSLSWLGKEDHSLELRLHAELPGILNWALDGLQRLTKNGNRFTRVASAEEAVTLMRDLASPVAAFVRERCVIGTDKQIEVQRLYSAYRAWCDENGHVKATKASFGRDLRAAIPSVKRRRLREEADDDRIYVYFGIDLAGGSDIGPALGPLGPEPTGRGADGSGPSGPRKSPMYAAPPGKGSHVPKSDDLPYDGPPVPVPNLGPDPLDEHGAPVAANFVTTIRTMLGDELIAKLQGTSLDRLDEYDALVVLNRGAEPGQLTPVVKGLIEDAIAGKDVSAWGVQKYGVQKTRDVEAEAKRPVATNGGNEPGLSVTRIRELRQCCLDHAEAQRRDTGEVDQAEIEEGLRIILREEVLPEFVEVELQRVMAAVFAA